MTVPGAAPPAPAPSDVTPVAAVGLLEPPAHPTGEARPAFRVRLDNFDGPFDLLLQLVGARRLDLTEVALSQVTDDFLGYLAELGDDADLGVVTEFLVVAATLLDLKAARLLPDPEMADADDLPGDQARDLLFARLLAYRAYQHAAELFAELSAAALHRYPRAVTLEDRYLGLLPPAEIGHDAEGFAALAAGVFLPKPPPQVSLEHIHTSTVSVAEHSELLRELLRARGSASFTELIAGCGATLEIVARFLGLLNLYRESQVLFDQAQPLGPLVVRWSESAPKVDRNAAADEDYA